jgi:ligand-binding sensor domain-containing protein/signal transduction histidine kinase
MRVARSLVCGALAAGALLAAQLPLRHYTPADGLANDAVYAIASDPRGFLWFGTGEGLSRFDGYSFSNLTAADGLPHRMVTQIVVDRDSVYWLATPNGLVRYRPDLPASNPARMAVFRPDLPEGIEYILKDHTGRIWSVTGRGVYVLYPKSVNPKLNLVDFWLTGKTPHYPWVEALTEDRDGAIWIGMYDGTLRRRLPDGRIEHYGSAEGIHVTSPGALEVQDLLTDRKGRIWVATVEGLYRLIPHPRPGVNIVEYRPGAREGMPTTRVYCLFESSKGDIWAGMYRWLGQFPSDGGPLRIWDKKNGLAEYGVMSIGEDRDGNLWLGTSDMGVMKLSSSGFETYSQEEGISAVTSISETLRGDLYAAAYQPNGTNLNLYVPRGDRFVAFQPKLPSGINYIGWRPGRPILQDHLGEWWMISESGLLRYPKSDRPERLAQIPPKAIYTRRDGLPHDGVIRIYEDRRGNLWIATEAYVVTVWNRAEERFDSVDGLAVRPFSFREDGAGSVWIGGEEGNLWRVQDGRASAVGGSGEGRGWINEILLDHAGRLWVATNSKGLLRFDRPAETAPQFRTYDQRDGLSSAIVRSLVESRDGFIYMGTGKGIDRLDPNSGRVRHYTNTDGVPLGQINSAYRDRDGVLWFGTTHGLIRLITNNPQPRSPLTIGITGVSVGGRPAPVSALGESSVRGLEIPPGPQDIQLDFVAPSYASWELPLYQYRTGNSPWSQAMQSRSVHYGQLKPGRYQFAVRAINAEGEVSATPAEVDFRVLPPVWQRLWFYALIAALISGAAIWAHRLRVNKLLQLERLRIGIATDLHDDLGSSLSRIAILSEVAQRGGNGEVGDTLRRIGELAREAIDSTGDIVWAVHPRKDRLSDLQRRMRHFSVDVLSVRNIALRWKVEEPGQDLELGGNLRRQIYLIFKESVNNVSRHSLATEAIIESGVVGDELMLRIRDNGCGFDLSNDGHGNGLKSICDRAARLGGTLQLYSEPGQGASVFLRVPLPK